MKKLFTGLLAFSLLGLFPTAKAFLINHSEEVWLNGSIVSEVFNLDSQLEEYEDLTIEVRFVGKNGKILETATLETVSIGGSEVNRYGSTYLEAPAKVIENTAYIEIVKATCIKNGKVVNIPLSEVGSKEFKPIPIKIKEKLY